MKTVTLTLVFFMMIALNVQCDGVHDQQVDIKGWLKELKHSLGNHHCHKNSQTPRPPQLPRNFSWKGKYVVPDIVDPRTGKLGITVPFTWWGEDGDVQMIAGGEDYPIFFTNFIYQNHLYTYTYKWPGLQPEFLPPLESCAPLGEFTLEDLNALLATATFVGPLILKNGQPVNHFRLPIVTPPPQPPGFYFRLPLMLGDFYVDQDNHKKFRQVLHFGIQNLYAPHLDEWIFIHKFRNGPSKIMLPECLRE